MADVVVGAVVGAVFNVGLEKLLGVIKMAAKCESDCIKLLSDLENHRPKLERIEIQLRNRNGEPLEALEEWLAESKNVRQIARQVVQEGLSGSKPVRKFSLFANRDLVKRIQEVRRKIDELSGGTSATTAILSTVLATSSNNPTSACTHQLHHCCSSPALMQAPSPVACPSHHASHSLPPLRITHSPSSFDPTFMSQHSSPVSGPGTPGSSSDHFGTSCPGSRQWFDEVAGFQDAERRTREAQRRHSISNSPQSSEPATPYAVKAPSSVAWRHRASHSLPPFLTTYSASSLVDPSMSPQSSPVSEHGNPGSSSSSVTYLDCWSQKSPAPGSGNSWDAPGSSRLQHSRSEEVVSMINPELQQTQGLYNYSVDHQFGTTTACQGSQQWLDEVARTLDADWRTLEARSLHRRHSIVNSSQSSDPVSALPLHKAPSKTKMSINSPGDLISM